MTKRTYLSQRPSIIKKTIDTIHPIYPPVHSSMRSDVELQQISSLSQPIRRCRYFIFYHTP
ncbi:hypothetical protein BC829DRAFT_388471 [Chytridium lagenaria]|nr:hypothetical protein BC829DRAFT_388471 [Chytridium lagenaria]